MLSREEAIRKHREMWNWIADRIKERKQTVRIESLKEAYIERHNECVLYSCYLCDYSIGMLEEGKYFPDRCKYCPLDWESTGDEDGIYQCLENHGEKGLYEEAMRTSLWEEQYALCKKIANLKEREIKEMRVVSQKCNDELARYCNIPFDSTGFTVTKEDDRYKILAYVYGVGQPYYLGSYKKESHAIFVVEALEAFNLIGAGTVYLPPEEALLDSFECIGAKRLDGEQITAEEASEEVKRIFTTNYWLEGDKLV